MKRNRVTEEQAIVELQDVYTKAKKEIYMQLKEGIITVEELAYSLDITPEQLEQKIESNDFGFYNETLQQINMRKTKKR